MYDAMMDGVGEALMRAAGAALAPGAAAGLAPDGPLDELGQRLADTMAAFGAAHLAVLASPEKRIAFLQQARPLDRMPRTASLLQAGPHLCWVHLRACCPKGSPSGRAKVCSEG